MCRSVDVAVHALGERNDNDGQSMRRLTTWRLNCRAEPGGEGTGLGHLQRPSLIATQGSESWCCPLSSAESAERCLPRWFRRTWDFELGSAGPCWDQQITRHRRRPHVRLGRSPESGPFRPWPTLRHPASGMADVTTNRLPSTSTADVSMRYSNRRTRNLSSVAGVRAHDAGLDRGDGVR